MCHIVPICHIFGGLKSVFFYGPGTGHESSFFGMDRGQNFAALDLLQYTMDLDKTDMAEFGYVSRAIMVLTFAIFKAFGPFCCSHL